MVGKNAGGIQSIRVAQHESIHTLNYILQQSALSSISAHLNNKVPPPLSRKSCQYLQSLARKATLRLDVSIKRSICQRCHSILLPGITCSNRIKQSKPSDLVVIASCNICGFKRRTPCPAIQSKRFKAQARKNRKHQIKLEWINLKRKVKTFAANNINSENPKVPVNLDESISSSKPTQRARRRAARIKAEMLNGKKFEHKPRKRNRRRQKAADIFVLDEEDRNDVIQGDVSVRTPQKARKKQIKPYKNEPKALRLDLPPYHDRLKLRTDVKPHWTDSLPSDLTENQRKALSTLRGDHFVTIGLGRGGTVGDVL